MCMYIKSSHCMPSKKSHCTTQINFYLSIIFQYKWKTFILKNCRFGFFTKLGVFSHYILMHSFSIIFFLLLPWNFEKHVIPFVIVSWCSLQSSSVFLHFVTQIGSFLLSSLLVIPLWFLNPSLSFLLMFFSSEMFSFISSISLLRVLI